MIKLLFQKIPILAKAFMLFFLVISVFGGFSYLLLNEFVGYMASQYALTVSLPLFLQSLDITVISLGLVSSCVIVGFYLFDIQTFYDRVLLVIRSSLAERKLETYFPHFFTGNNLHSGIKHLNEVLSLYKTFSTMKSARIVLEMNSIKLIINNMSEGVLFIDKEKVVTHINHSAEQMLQLIPGEIIGESVSRKINNDVFLDLADKALEFDQKVIDHELKFKEGGPSLLINIFPVKDKFGEPVRALVILKGNSEIKKEEKES